MGRRERYWPEVILIISTGVGIIGVATHPSVTIRFTPLYLLVNFALLTRRLRSGVQLMFAAISAAVIGFTAEVVGVQTGVLFGDYAYGGILGPGFLGVPIMLMIMWALVMLAIWSLLPQRYGAWRIIAAAVLAVVYDAALEHFATRYDLWGWNGSIPLSNYIGWFIIAALIASAYYAKGVALPRTKFAPLLLLMHLLYFVSALIINTYIV